MPDVALPSAATIMPRSGSQGHSWLLRLVDAGLAGCIFVVPLLMGGRQALGQWVLAALAIGVALLWTARVGLQDHPTWRWSGAEPVLLAGVLLLVLQLISWPAAILHWLAPHTADLLPLWKPAGQPGFTLGPWSQISLTPAATRAGLVIYLAYVLLFAVVVQRVRCIEDVERLTRWCAVSAVLMAALGIAQFATSNGKFFWLYQHPFTDTYDGAKGAFTNRNHFAHFLALGTAPLVAWLLSRPGIRDRRRARDTFARESAGTDGRTTFGPLALGVVVFGGLLSLSRGGILMILLAASVEVWFCYRAARLQLRHLLAFAAAVLIIGAALVICGYERVSRRLSELTTNSVEKLDHDAGRRAIWGAVVQAIPQAPVLGTGVGSLREVYPMYLDEGCQRPYYYSHAENGPLQVALETGLTGVALLLAGLGWCGYWCFQALRRAPSSRWLIVAGAIAACLMVGVVHSLVDFVWYVPGCMAITVILAACACRLCQLAGPRDRQDSRRQPVPQIVAVTMLVGLVTVGACMLYNRWGPVLAERHWHRYLALQREAPSQLPPAADRLGETVRRPADVAGLARQEELLRELEMAADWDPDNPRTQLALAGAYLRHFHWSVQGSNNAMPLGQISDAATEARFPTRAAFEQWLGRSIGPAARDLAPALRHARLSLSGCPLLGEGYLYLANLVFLEGHDRVAKKACVKQALQVRPYDGVVLFGAGLEAWLAGDHEEGLACWQRSFHADRGYQQQIFACLANRSPAGDCEPQIRFLLEAFRPDLAGVRLLYQQYRKIAAPAELGLLREHYLRAATAAAETLPRDEAADLWLELCVVHREANEGTRALACARNALRDAPHSYPVRWALVQALFAEGQLVESEPHIEWCLRRRPQDAVLLHMLTEAVRHRVAHHEDREGTKR